MPTRQGINPPSQGRRERERTAAAVAGVVTRPQMLRPFVNKLSIPLNVLGFILFSLTFYCANGIDNKVLIVGKELFKELCHCTWDLAIISFKDSNLTLIPAIFSLQLKKGISDVGMNRLRKLLNTEKLIFKTEDLDEVNHNGGMYVLITVEPEGVVALPSFGTGLAGDSYNDVGSGHLPICDELMLGLPYKVWPVVVFAALCVLLGFLMPRFIPPFLLPRDEDLRSINQIVAEKDS
ncbi:hypothetical protein Cgig2_027921 [Carnegiea gigantea]|uniref:Uncharacterized protein n=1 Tax=Carnegiea gigantea TaxID=171969 RepID=A0A9Q1KMT6_9CARY|nr:hypothetical protein Cgig2_027921 [Carnegiea gigantea]